MTVCRLHRLNDAEWHGFQYFTCHNVDIQSTAGYKEYLSRVAARDETDAEKRNLGQMCHALVCRRTEPAESTMPLIYLELSDTESWNFTTFIRVNHTFWVWTFFR